MYTIKRQGKTYDEYRALILERVEAKNLDAGDETAMLAKQYEENDEWFEKHQNLHDLKQRIKDLEDLPLAISFSGVSQKNTALVVKQILGGDEDLLASLESVKPQIEEFQAKEKEKKDKRQAVKARKSEIKEWLKDIDFKDWKAVDTKKAIIFLMRNALDEQDN